MVEFNFKVPVLQEDGSITIEPNFPKEGPINEIMALARNSELPKLLKEAGELTPEEDKQIQYHRLLNKQPVYVGRKGKEVFDAIFLDELAIKEIPRVHDWMCELRQLLLRRGTGEDMDRSGFEMFLTNSKEPRTRFYQLGFNVNPQATMISAARVCKTTINDPSVVAKATRLAALISTELLEAYVPADILALLQQQAITDVPLTMGHEKNKYTTGLQLNISSADANTLKLELGVGGDLHIDKDDSPRNYTVLLSLTNIPEGHWPGRTLYVDLRLYTVMAPMTVFIFKGCRSHMSLGPRPMNGSTRKAYQPAAEVPKLDPAGFIYSRITAIVYPKDFVLLNSATHVRSTTPRDFFGKEGIATNNPEVLPVALAAFGTLENQWGFQAQSFACNRTRHSRQDYNIVVPSAQTIAGMFQYRKDGKVLTPDIAEIQKVIDANTKSPATDAHKKALDVFTRKCRGTLSMKGYNRGLRQGAAQWVEKLGSTFEHMDPMKPEQRDKSIVTKGSRPYVHEVFGPKPYQCEHCDLRFPENNPARAHHLDYHPEFEWASLEPTLDPSYTPPYDSEDEAETTDNSDITGDNADRAEDIEDEVVENKAVRKEGVEEKEAEKEEEVEPPVSKKRQASASPVVKKKFKFVLKDFRWGSGYKKPEKPEKP